MDLTDKAKTLIRRPRCAFCKKEKDGHCMGKGLTTTYRNPKRVVMKERKCSAYTYSEEKLVAYLKCRKEVPSTMRPSWYWEKGSTVRKFLAQMAANYNLATTANSVPEVVSIGGSSLPKEMMLPVTDNQETKCTTSGPN